MYILQFKDRLYYAGMYNDSVKITTKHTEAYKFERIGDAMKVASKLKYNTIIKKL